MVWEALFDVVIMGRLRSRPSRERLLVWRCGESDGLSDSEEVNEGEGEAADDMVVLEEMDADRGSRRRRLEGISGLLLRLSDRVISA
jgi:hypothetical protein